MGRSYRVGDGGYGTQRCCQTETGFKKLIHLCDFLRYVGNRAFGGRPEEAPLGPMFGEDRSAMTRRDLLKGALLSPVVARAAVAGKSETRQVLSHDSNSRKDASALRIRGALPWHNFLSGPIAWNIDDYDQYLDWLKRLNLNLLVLHFYTGGRERYVDYVQPMVCIKYRNVVPEAAMETSHTPRWGYRPLPVSKFAFGSGKLFKSTEELDAFGSKAALLAHTNNERYELAQGQIRKVIKRAHDREIRVALGFEFGVYPPELFSVVPQNSYIHSVMLPDPTHPSSIEILRITLDNILQNYPGVDWVWLWMGEQPGRCVKKNLSSKLRELIRRDTPLFQSAEESDAFTGVWSLSYIRTAYAHLKKNAPQVRLAVGGWGGSNQFSPLLTGLDKALPGDIALACLNPAQGQLPQVTALAEIAKHRDTIAIPWLEGDSKLWHPQPRVSYLHEQVQLAHKQGLAGVVAIHWRMEDIRANMEAFAEFAENPQGAPEVEAFYHRHSINQYGAVAGPALAPLLAQIDIRHLFEQLRSPEYFPYDPSWGRMSGPLRRNIQEILEAAEKFARTERNPQHSSNLRWLTGAFRFTLLLDQVSQGLEAAYNLKQRFEEDCIVSNRDVAAARNGLDRVPIKALFETYATRVRSRGELGVLSSMNQKLWLEYNDLRTFLNSL